MGPSGALFIRDIGGLARQFWVPDGADEGAYVAFPFEDLMGVLALESQRNQCMVLAGDAGLPEGIAEALQRVGVLPFRSFFAESAAAKGFAGTDPARCGVAAGGDMDEPPLRGFWLGRDLEERTVLRLFLSEADRHEQAACCRRG